MKWISVKDKLPSTTHDLLVYTKDGNIMNAWYCTDEFVLDVCDAYIDDFIADKDEITHWIFVKDVPKPKDNQVDKDEIELPLAPKLPEWMQKEEDEWWKGVEKLSSVNEELLNKK